MENKIIKIIEKILSLCFLSACILFIIFGVYFIVLDTVFKDRYYPRTQIFGNNVGFMLKSEADNIFFDELNKFNEGIFFKADEFSKEYKPENIGVEIDLNDTLKNSFKYGREPLTPESIKDRFSLLIFGKDFKLDYLIRKDNLDNFIKSEIEPLGVLPNDINLIKIGNDFEILLEKQGRSIDKENLIYNISQRTAFLSINPINITFVSLHSVINQNEWKNIKKEIKQIISSPVNFEFEDKLWELREDILEDWIILTIVDKELEGGFYKKKIIVDLDREKFVEYLKTIEPDININPKNAKFQLIDDKVELLEPSAMGRELLIDGNYEKFKEAAGNNDRTIELATKERGAEITKNNIKEYGINELVGEGASNFVGSPRNRIHNINVAVDKLNGVLLAPNETYSLVENIGEVNAESGYLPELVIKDNKTIPEFGGGLCQIATTVFRAAVNTGLDVIERQSHSYAVSYYKPHGIDATIYIPKPDLQFINDTDSYILIQAKVERHNLIFEFYGTKDGREVRIEGPEYWDRKPDGAFKARFNQIVKMPDGSERKDKFVSYYDSPDKYH